MEERKLVDKLLLSEPILESSFSFSNPAGDIVGATTGATTGATAERPHSEYGAMNHINWLSDSDDDTKVNGKRVEDKIKEMHAKHVAASSPALSSVQPTGETLQLSPVNARSSAKVSKPSSKASTRRKKQKKSLGKDKPLYSRKELNEANRSTRRKEELLSEMVIQISCSLYYKIFDDKCMKTVFEYTKQEYLSSELPIITWKRLVKARYDKERDIFVPCPATEKKERHIVLYYQSEEFLKILQNDELTRVFDTCRNRARREDPELDCLFIIILEGLDQYLNKLKNLEERRYKKSVLERMSSINSNSSTQASEEESKLACKASDVEQIINEAQLRYGVNVLNVRNNQDAIQWLHSLTYTISLALYDKYQRNTNLANLGTVRSGTDTKTTFLQTIKQLKYMTEPKAEKLYSFYNSIYSLFQCYLRQDSLGKDSNGKNLLPPLTDAAMKKLLTSESPDEIIFD